MKKWNHENSAIGPGWQVFVRPLIAAIESLGGEIAQVKEKFGGLRIYYHSTTTEHIKDMDALVRIGEDLAAENCEECGTRNTQLVTIGHGWIKNLCPQCKKVADGTS